MPQGNTKYIENKELLKNPKVQAMLKVISSAEGATYNTRVGGAKFDDLSKKPGKAVYIPSIKQYSSAEGRFQFINPTWEGLSKDLGLKDFSPESQDIAAVELIKRRGALNDILNDNFDVAVNKLAPEWASLPTASGKGYYAGQKAKKIDKLRNIYFGSRDQPTPPQETQPKTSDYEEFTPYLATNTGTQQTAGEYKEPKEVSQAKQELIQAQNEENFIKEIQSSLQPQQQIIPEQPNYLQSQELFTLAPVEEIQYIQQPEFMAQRGGEIPVDSMGMWKYPNQTVIIPSGEITMAPNPFTGEPFSKPILGISQQTGEKKIMYPNKNYRFKNTTSVLEKIL